MRVEIIEYDSLYDLAYGCSIFCVIDIYIYIVYYWYRYCSLVLSCQYHSLFLKKTILCSFLLLLLLCISCVWKLTQKIRNVILTKFLSLVVQEVIKVMSSTASDRIFFQNNKLPFRWRKYEMEASRWWKWNWHLFITAYQRLSTRL